MVEFCKTCIMPNSRPRITFDQDGICNACNHSKDKEQINWELRKTEFLEILSNLKKIKNRNKFMIVLFLGREVETQVYCS